MADAVVVTVVRDSQMYRKVHLTNISDGTGESAVVKIDKSTLIAPDGSEPASLDIVACRWAIQGMTSVRLLWDHTTDDVAMVLTGSGFEDFSDDGPAVMKDTRRDGVKADPRSSGGTGDLLLTTNGAVNGGTYDITLAVRKTSN